MGCLSAPAGQNLWLKLDTSIHPTYIFHSFSPLVLRVYADTILPAGSTAIKRNIVSKWSYIWPPWLIFKVMVKKLISKHQLSFTPLSSFCKLITSSWEHSRPWIMNVNSSSCWLHLRMHLFFSLSYTQSFSYCLPLLLTQEATESAKDVKKQ